RETAAAVIPGETRPPLWERWAWSAGDPRLALVLTVVVVVMVMMVMLHDRAAIRPGRRAAGELERGRLRQAARDCERRGRRRHDQGEGRGDRGRGGSRRNPSTEAAERSEIHGRDGSRVSSDFSIDAVRTPNPKVRRARA